MENGKGFGGKLLGKKFLKPKTKNQ